MLTPDMAGFFIKDFLKQDPYKLATEIIVNFFESPSSEKRACFCIDESHDVYLYNGYVF